jgi:hypothetical protein
MREEGAKKAQRPQREIYRKVEEVEKGRRRGEGHFRLGRQWEGGKPIISLKCR